MELLIGLIIIGLALAWYWGSKQKEVVETAPYKVDTPPAAEPAPAPVAEVKVEEPAPVAEVKVEELAPIVEAVVEAAPAKKPRKPRAPKVVAETPAAKKAAPVKKAAAIKAAPKATAKSKKA